MFTLAERIAIAAVVLLLCAGTWLHVRPAPDRWGGWEEVEPPGVLAEPGSENPTIRVHVAGQVANPGVYELEMGARVIDAIRAAGGATADGNPNALNLAAPVSDGSRVWVPAGDQEEAGERGEPSPGGGAPGAVNVNRASLAELQHLPGIGPVLASRIIEHRQKHGFFQVPEDLLAVSGIGPKTLERLRPLLVLD